MAKYKKELTTFDVELGGENVSVDMGEVADLIYGVGVNVDFIIKKEQMTVFENVNGTYLICVPCESDATYDHYGSWDANHEYDVYRKCNAELTVLPDGTIVSAKLTNVQGASIYGEQHRPLYQDIHYGLKPKVMDYLSAKPQRALLVNLHKIKTPKELNLFIKFAKHALDNSTMQYRKAKDIKSKLSAKVEKRIDKAQGKAQEELSK